MSGLSLVLGMGRLVLELASAPIDGGDAVSTRAYDLSSWRYDILIANPVNLGQRMLQLAYM